MRRLIMLGYAAAMTGCAGPPLQLYTLAPADTGAESQSLGAAPVVIAVARVAVPDAWDNQDILVQDGDTLRRSSTGRWASRLSLGITDLLTARLAARRPDALVTDQPQTVPASYRLAVNISRLGVSAAGVATLQADWTIVPADAAKPVRRGRAGLTARGGVQTDGAVVALERELAGELANRIDLSGL